MNQILSFQEGGKPWNANEEKKKFSVAISRFKRDSDRHFVCKSHKGLHTIEWHFSYPRHFIESTEQF